MLSSNAQDNAPTGTEISFLEGPKASKLNLISPTVSIPPVPKAGALVTSDLQYPEEGCLSYSVLKRLPLQGKSPALAKRNMMLCSPQIHT